MTTAPFGFLRVAAACPPVRVADPERNVDAILACLAEAARQDVQVLVLPELSITGYTCGDLFFSLDTLVAGAERALARLLRETKDSKMVVLAGLPVLQGSRLFNAAALLQSGAVRGVVPKTFLPGYKEYYEERWFSSAREAVPGLLPLAGSEVAFGTDLLFAVEGEPGVVIGIEICEDLWAPIPPSSTLAIAGATVILNPSAGNDLVAKADYRRQLVAQQSARTLCAYAYANAGVHESTTDLVFGGHLLVAENGVVVAESERFRREGELVVVDVDTDRLRVERARQTSFAEAVHGTPGAHRTVWLQPIPVEPSRPLRRVIEPHPFVPADPATVDARCQEVFSIQTAGLARRLEHVGARRLVLGLSGGLDSTLALLVCARTLDLLGRPRGEVLAVTMPGFGTTQRTLQSARRLAAAWGAELREIDIRPACEQHMRDLGLHPEDRSVTFQNLQARERTQLLMDLANKEDGIAVGTGDLSEIALGFATFAGDHISMYGVNASVPKTLVRRLVAWVADHLSSGEERAVLQAVLETPVSPELLPPGADGVVQRTEDVIGPYELHDFFLHCLLRLGAGPRKIVHLACHAFAGRYDQASVRHWLRVFLERFFAQQFKRSVMPDGPKVGSVSLSPRGDWRMPSDASAAAWLRELEQGGSR
jgi:NAD+ synthase (glutamine-hydrolysing)